MDHLRRVTNTDDNSNRGAWAGALLLAGTYILSHLIRPNREPPAGDERNLVAAQYAMVFTKQVLIRTYEDVNNDRVLALAAGVVFYGLLALFPAITALVSSYALFANPTTISQHLAALKGIMPQGAYDILDQQINRIASITTGDLSLAFFVSLAISIWSANSGVKAIIDVLNIAYNVKEQRGLIWLNMVSLIFTVGAIIGLLIGIGAIVAVPIAISYLPVGEFSGAIIVWLRWPVLLVLLILALAVLYRFGPNHEKPHWQWISPGAVFAALAWLVGSALLSWYLSRFANYGATYGSLGAAIGLMVWLWMSAIVVLIGAELNAAIEGVRAHFHRGADLNMDGA